MIVDNALIEKLSTLSKLEFKQEQLEEIKGDLNKILSFMEKLNELDTSGVEPLVYVNDDVNVFRDDEVIQIVSKEEVLSNAALKNSDYFKVPKFVKSV